MQAFAVGPWLGGIAAPPDVFAPARPGMGLGNDAARRNQTFLLAAAKPWINDLGLYPVD